MNKKTKKLLRKAGFIFWSNEPWRPAGAKIDWSCDYNREMKRFVKLLVNDMADNFAHNDEIRELILKRYLDK
jgi:hypothetical protein